MLGAERSSPRIWRPRWGCSGLRKRRGESGSQRLRRTWRRGGYNFQARATSFVYARVLAGQPMNFAARRYPVPLAVWAESGGPGDDVRVECEGGVVVFYTLDWAGNVIPSNDNVIGGTSGAQANVIHDNKGAGVRVNGGAGNSILTNRFFANGGLGILLGFQGGVGFNDPKDPDGGTNNRQNYTVLTSAERNSATGETTITGSLNSNPNQTYTIQCFKADADVTDHGEGETFLGETTATTNADGDATFTCTTTKDALAAGDEVTSTATNTSGTAANTRIGDTSQFSRNVVVTTGP